MSDNLDVSVTTPVVIVVDDDDALRASLKFALEIEGFSVRAYSTGAEVFDDPELSSCGCFIIDQKLPGMSGLELVAALKRRHIDAPAVLITSNPSIIMQERAARDGIPIIEKPLLSNVLFECVRDVIARSRPFY